MDRIKNNLSSLVCAVIGLLVIVFSFIPAITYAIDAFGIEFSTSVNQFGVMGMTSGNLTLEVNGGNADFESGFLGALAGISSILAFIATLALLIWGVLNLLKAFKVVSVLPEELPTEKLSVMFLLLNLVANILTFVCILLFCLDNQENQGTASAGLYVAVGVYLNLILSVLGIVAQKLLPHFFHKTPAASEETAEPAETTTE